MHNHWGPWRLDKEKEILYQEDKGPHTDWIDLDRCDTSAEVLDTIIHFSRKFAHPGGEVAIAGDGPGSRRDPRPDGQPLLVRQVHDAQAEAAERGDRQRAGREQVRPALTKL